MLVIRIDSPVPLVDQIVAGLRTAIASRALKPGDALPTVRQLAADLGIHMNTVARAYRALEANGLVTTRRGRGTEVSAAHDSVARPAAELERRLREALADARLAGLDRPAAERLSQDVLNSLWPEDRR